MAATVMAAALGLGEARRLGEAAAAPKLEMGAARCGHPVFTVGKQRGVQGKEGGVGGADSDSAAAESPA